MIYLLALHSVTCQKTVIALLLKVMENTHKKKRLSDLCADAFTALENNSLDSRQSAKVNSTFGPHVKANKPELSNYSQLFAQVKKQLESL